MRACVSVYTRACLISFSLFSPTSLPLLPPTQSWQDPNLFVLAYVCLGVFGKKGQISGGDGRREGGEEQNGLAGQAA